jgi:uncharacterized protein YukE
MSTMVGADADALDELSRQLEQTGALIRRSAAQLGRSLGAAPWHGRSADRFRQSWTQDYRRCMADAASFLDQAGDELRRHAREQRAASSAQGSGPFGQCYRRVDGSTGQVDRPWYQRWMEEYLSGRLNDELFAILDIVSLFLRDSNPLGKVVPGLSIILGGLTMWRSWNDFFNDHPYSGNFGLLESYSDYLSFASGALGVVGGVMMFTPLAPVGAALLTASLVIGATSLGIDYGLKAWDKWGRKAWNAKILPGIKDTWNDVRSTASSAFRSVTSTASDTWRAATSVVDVTTRPFRDAATGITSLGKKALSWL